MKRQNSGGKQKTNKKPNTNNNTNNKKEPKAKRASSIEDALSVLPVDDVEIFAKIAENKINNNIAETPKNDVNGNIPISEKVLTKKERKAMRKAENNNIVETPINGVNGDVPMSEKVLTKKERKAIRKAEKKQKMKEAELNGGLMDQNGNTEAENNIIETPINGVNGDVPISEKVLTKKERKAISKVEKKQKNKESESELNGSLIAQNGNTQAENNNQDGNQKVKLNSKKEENTKQQEEKNDEPQEGIKKSTLKNKRKRARQREELVAKLDAKIEEEKAKEEAAEKAAEKEDGEISEPNFSKIDAHFLTDEVNIEGDITVNPIKRFDDPLIPPLFYPIFSSFESPTTIQRYTWPVLLQDRDVVAIAKTGSGKTLAYGVPCLDKIKKGYLPSMLVIAPTRELALQIHEVLSSLARLKGLKAVVVYGGASKSLQKGKLNNADIIVATPGRLLDFLDGGELDLSNVSCLVLDEADQMLDMGFEREMIRIKRYVPTDRLTAMFSATWPLTVQDLARMYFKREPVLISVGHLSHTPTANKSIKQYVELRMDSHEKSERLKEILNQYKENDKVLVFANMKAHCRNIYTFLNRNGYNCGILSSASSQQIREKTLWLFKKGRICILVATDVASRGLDIPDVEAVINYDFPQTIENYVHRIGRTGRAGKTGIAYTFIDRTDTPKIMKEFVTVLETAGQEVPQYISKFEPLPNQRRGRGRGRRHSENYTHYNRDQRNKAPQRWNSSNGASNRGASDLLSQLANADPKTLQAVKTLLFK